jgi:hypothetical protein
MTRPRLGVTPMGSQASKTRRLFYCLSIYVILTFLWRFGVPAHEEAEPDTLIYFEILFEFVSVAGLVVLFTQLRSQDGDAAQAPPAALFWIALVAAIGILIMRFSTTDGWYTGHRVYQIGYGTIETAPQNRADVAGDA